MANFSMCKWSTCIQKDVCQRFSGIPETNNQQIYMHFENKCCLKNDWYWFYGDRSKMIKVELLIEENEKEMSTYEGHNEQNIIKSPPHEDK